MYTCAFANNQVSRCERPSCRPRSTKSTTATLGHSLPAGADRLQRARRCAAAPGGRAGWCRGTRECAQAQTPPGWRIAHGVRAKTPAQGFARTGAGQVRADRDVVLEPVGTGHRHVNDRANWWWI